MRSGSRFGNPGLDSLACNGDGHVAACHFNYNGDGNGLFIRNPNLCVVDGHYHDYHRNVSFLCVNTGWKCEMPGMEYARTVGGWDNNE